MSTLGLHNHAFPGRANIRNIPVMAVAPPLCYHVLKTKKQVGIGGKWESPDRVHAESLRIEHFCPDSVHTPCTELKLLYDAENLYGVFRVQDRYVLCRQSEYQADVTRDACVSAYLRPKPERGYLALDINCCGVLRAQYIEEPDKSNNTHPMKIVPLPWKHGHQIRIYTSQFGTVDPEKTDEMTWYVEFVLPFSVVESYVGPLAPFEQPWHANFYKSCTACSHPHRASWAPLTDGVSFHQPDCFQPIHFA